MKRLVLLAALPLAQSLPASRVHASPDPHFGPCRRPDLALVLAG